MPGLATIYDVLIDGKEIGEAICHTSMEGLDVLPADKNLVGVNLQLIGVDERESILRKHLAGIRENYQFILIVGTPALDLLRQRFNDGSRLRSDPNSVRILRSRGRLAVDGYD